MLSYFFIGGLPIVPPMGSCRYVPNVPPVFGQRPFDSLPIDVLFNSQPSHNAQNVGAEETSDESTSLTSSGGSYAWYDVETNEHLYRPMSNSPTTSEYEAFLVESYENYYLPRSVRSDLTDSFGLHRVRRYNAHPLRAISPEAVSDVVYRGSPTISSSSSPSDFQWIPDSYSDGSFQDNFSDDTVTCSTPTYGLSLSDVYFENIDNSNQAQDPPVVEPVQEEVLAPYPLNHLPIHVRRQLAYPAGFELYQNLVHQIFDLPTENRMWAPDQEEQ